MGKKVQGLVSCSVIVLACLLATSSLAQQDTSATIKNERARAVDKIKEINRWGPEARIVGDLADNLDQIIQSGRNADILIGWGLTRDRQAYRFHWTDNRFSFERLTPEEATKQGFAEMTMGVKRLERAGAVTNPTGEKLTQEEAFARGHQYYISNAVLGEPAGTAHLGKSLRGHVQLVRGERAAGDVVLEIKWTVPGVTHSMYAYPNVPAGREPKDVAFEFTGFSNEKDISQYQNEIKAVLRVVAPPKAGVQVVPLSNALAVTFRVAP